MSYFILLSSYSGFSFFYPQFNVSMSMFKFTPYNINLELQFTKTNMNRPLCSFFINGLCNRKNHDCRTFSVHCLVLMETCIFLLIATSFQSVHCQSALCYEPQTELNSREGAWERLYMERDPLVLSSLMWSWLEQLKDPVISSEDVKALSERNVNPQNALDSLEKVAVFSRQISQNIIYIFSHSFVSASCLVWCTVTLLVVKGLRDCGTNHKSTTDNLQLSFEKNWKSFK